MRPVTRALRKELQRVVVYGRRCDVGKHLTCGVFPRLFIAAVLVRFRQHLIDEGAEPGVIALETDAVGLFREGLAGDLELALVLRREAGQELNKGEARNSLARAVFIHRLGEIRDRTYENQQHRSSGLNLLVTAIILWNTRYLESAVATLRKFEDVPDHLMAHLSPLGWEHVNLTGDYVWGSQQILSENIVGLRPLRSIPEVTKKAA